MFVDARTVSDGVRIDADVVVAGAGAAGITIAVELAGKGISTVLLESGGLERNSQTNELNVGAAAGLPYLPLEDTRSRFLGGSTNCWGGRCRPFEREDFQPRTWVHASGWPITYDHLVPYYERAGSAFRLGSRDFDPGSFERSNGDPRTRLLPFDSGRIVNEIHQFSGPARFGELFRPTLQTSTNIRCFLHANLVGIETDANATTVESVRVATLSGRRFNVCPRVLVLALGGIENARALLLPSPSAPKGVGNPYDQVGRYFMEHPSFRSGLFTRAASGPSLAFYDSTYNEGFAPGGVSAAASFALTAAVQQEEELLRNRMLLYTTFAGEENPGREAARRLIGRARGGRRFTGRDIATFARHAPQVATGVVARRLNRLARKTHLFTIVEPEPNPESRVTLTDERDALAVNRVQLTLRLTGRVERTLTRAQQILSDELRTIGAGELAFDDDRRLDWCCHHMGTTRMSSDARHGVVNDNCRVHGVQNLYVAGSSVFPTGGSDMPTYTIVALAIRLADHLHALLAPSSRRG